jgi:SAM-dependent methyltransferase
MSVARLDIRHRLPEVMDQPDLDPESHDQALDGLARINFWSGSARLVWSAIHDRLPEARTHPLRILDVATGAGDIPIWLWQRSRRSGLPWTIAACDRSPVAVEHARSRAREAEVDVHFFEWDALVGRLPGGYDVIVNSLFLHHLDEEFAEDFLRSMATVAQRLVVVNDLERSALGYKLAWAGTRLLSRSPVVHVDGPRSVEAAFTIAEARELAEDAQLSGARIGRRWPCRFLLTWSPP